MKSINNITLYDLMAEDLDIWVTKSKEFGFEVQIDDERGKSLVNDKGIHPYAAESFADFCRRYLASYDKASQSEGV